MIIRHICVEGWDYIGQWSGVNLRQFLERIGADLRAKYVSFRCADDYYGSIDMATRAASADHPGDEIRPGTDHRSVRFSVAAAHRVKLGFKNPKWITAIEVTNTYRGGYWEDRGFNWFSGI